MSGQVEWSSRAVQEWSEILNYWVNRNKSNAYSIKLDRILTDKLELICRSPGTGQETDLDNVRIKIVRDYKVYYRILRESIEILTIWDTRRNPKKFKL